MQNSLSAATTPVELILPTNSQLSNPSNRSPSKAGCMPEDIKLQLPPIILPLLNSQQCGSGIAISGALATPAQLPGENMSRELTRP